MNGMERINRIYEKLADAESRFIFDLRMTFLLYGDDTIFWKNIKRNRNWVCPNINNDFIVFGAGMMGNFYCDILETAGKNVFAFCDNFQHGEVRGKAIITVEQAVQYKKPIVIPWGGYFKDAQKQLLNFGIDKKYIMQEPDIRSYTGVQYFDVWSPKEKEILIDCGAYDGDTIKQFVEWTNSKYDRIYAFEPSIRNYEKCKRYLEESEIRNCDLINKGTWSGKETFTLMTSEFDTGDSITKVFDADYSVIESVSIDEALQGSRATFIKMDVEGSELESLKGAKNTIVRYQPRLAIAVYHKNTDFLDIPNYILDLNDNYKLKLRHYASNNCETVLYAE